MTPAGKRIVCEIPFRSGGGFVRIECDSYSDLPEEERLFVASVVDSMMEHTRKERIAPEPAPEQL